MTHKFVLSLLPFLLLLLINGEGSFARYIKLPQENVEEKQVDQSYLDGWLKNPLKNQKLISNSNQVYLDGWLKDTRSESAKSTPDANQVYLDGWLKNTRAEKEKSNPDSNQVYLDGWLKDTRAEKDKSIVESN
ncbi:uncharacterized protein LOC131657304 [Vicia villosa]|uniref:uncharacterized protein LOC131657304 n=1 Tax=Vicia villosa TaxID=3911 RepID=UPI00273B6148|nr:uncharacterized protein LOC131657304 [Vicia villosa]